jgi:hypothetical protein
MIYHVSTSIRGLLGKSDEMLELLFERNAYQLRESLNESLEKGENYIGSENCEGFCPITGKCPGHITEKVPIKPLLILKELRRKKESITFLTARSMGAKEAYQEAINLINEIYKNEISSQHNITES